MEKLLTILKNNIILFFVDGYIFFTYCLFRFGVWVYPNQHNNKLLLFVLATILSFSIGFLLSSHWLKKKTIQEKKHINRNLLFYVVVDGLIMVPYCYGRTGRWFPNVIESLSNLRLAYWESALAVTHKGITHYIAAIGVLFIIPLILLTFYYWSSIEKKIKIISVFEIVFFYMVEISTGHNRGIFLYSIMIFVALVVYLCRENNIKKIAIKALVAFILILLSALYFGISIKARNTGTIAEMSESEKTVKEIQLESEYTRQMLDDYGYNENGVWCSDEDMELFENNMNEVNSINPYYIDELTYAYVDITHPLYRLTPDVARFTMTQMSYYITHGYQGVNIALDIPFSFSYGIGTNVFLRNTFKSITGIDAYKNTYVYKLNQRGYPISLKWGTGFLQFASDLSWIGVIVGACIMGGVLATLWWSITRRNDATALVAICPLVYYLVMIVSWWQPGMSGSDFVLLHGTMIMWILGFMKKKR